MLRPLGDHLVVEIEPEKECTSGGIIRVSPEPVRTGKVLAVGPGKRYPDKFVPTVIKPGERIAFFKAVTDTKSGKQVTYALEDNQVLLRETDVLFVLPEESKVEVTV